MPTWPNANSTSAWWKNENPSPTFFNFPRFYFLSGKIDPLYVLVIQLSKLLCNLFEFQTEKFDKNLD